jgi:hypothetical protein
MTSRVTFYRCNDDKPKRNRGDTIFAIIVTSAAIIINLKLYFCGRGLSRMEEAEIGKE